MIPEAVAERIASFSPARIERIDEPSLGLRAYLVLDSLALGPAAGGVRTKAYADEADAAHDACRLAQAMTRKCALGGLDAGGGKTVVIDSPELDRRRAFEFLGRFIDGLGGDFRTAGDFGTTGEDLAAMARHTAFVHTETQSLAGAVGRGVLRCAEACAERAGRPGISGLRVAVQGCGDIGAAVAEALAGAGAQVLVADLDEARARGVAERIGAQVVPAAEILSTEVDIVSPCAVGDVIDAELAGRLRAWAVCGGANNICTDDAAHEALHRARVLFVPDLISSAGAVIEGIGRTVMGLDDRERLIDALRQTARLVLEDAERDGRPPIVHAIRRAEVRIAESE